MKFKPFLVALCAFAAILAGCEQPQPDYEEASIKLSTNEITLDAGAVSQTVTLNTTRQWKVKDLAADWVTVSPMSGNASFEAQTITISVLPNAEHNRTVDIEFFGGIVSDILTVNQNGEKGVVLPGDGSLENPFSASEAHDYVAALPADASTSQYFYIKGVVSKVVSIDTGSYGNANFYIVDEDDPNSSDFYCFQIMYLDGAKFTSEDQLQAGDKVTVYAQVVNYRGNTPETVGKGSGKLYSINGQQGEGGGDDDKPGTPEGSGTKDDPFNATAAHNAAAALAADAPTTQFYYIKGKVSKIVSIDTGSYGNANFYISDDGNASSTDLYCFQIMYLGGEKFTSSNQLNVGDDVTVYAQLVNYRGNTPETVGKGSGKIVALNGKTDGGDDDGDDDKPGTPEGSGTESDPFNATAAHNTAAALAADTPTEEYYYIKGVVSKIVSIDTGSYGNANFYISDDGNASSTDLYCFQIMYLGGEKFTSSNQLKVGDEVVVYAQLTNYRGNTPETVGKGSGKLISINGKTEGEEGDDDDDDDNPVVKTAYKYNKATAVTAGKQYLIVAEGQAATAITGNYGYLQVKAVEDEDGVITVVPESLDFTFEATDGGYYIKQADGRYLYMSGDYNSFNVTTTPDAAAVWTVDVTDGCFVITNTAMSKTIQFDTTYSSYGSYPDVRGVYPVLYEKTGETVEVEEEEAGGGSTNLKWSKGNGGYDDVTVTANGQSISPAFKLGTSKAGGEITFTIPAGTKKISFYAVSWKGNATTLTLSAGGYELKTFNPAANDGASNNSPFTISVSASDWYSLEYEFTAETQVTFSSPKRVVFWNVHAE